MELFETHKNHGIKTHTREEGRLRAAVSLGGITNNHSLSLHNGPYNGDWFSRTLMTYYGRKAETYVLPQFSLRLVGV